MSPAITQTNAVLIDTIDDISEPLHSMSSLTPLVRLLALAYRIRTPDHDDTQERLLTLMHTTSPSAGPGDRRASTDNPKGYSREEVHNSFINFLFPVLSGMAGLGEFETAVSAFTEPADFRDFWNFEGHNLITDFVAHDGPGGVMKGSDIHFQDVFVKDPNCRVALGKQKGILMLVPRDAQVGDELWWEEDVRQLVVTGPGHEGCRSEGEAYIEGATRKAVLEIENGQMGAPKGSPVAFKTDINWKS